MALGAGKSAVMTMILNQGMAVVLAGLGLGLLLAFALRRYVETMLFISALDVWVWTGTATLLVVVGASACLWPALRATRIDPVVALRSE